MILVKLASEKSPALWRAYSSTDRNAATSSACCSSGVLSLNLCGLPTGSNILSALLGCSCPLAPCRREATDRWLPTGQ
eukprot:11185666-Lingulodinium_polyedra.AAC.1